MYDLAHVVGVRARKGAWSSAVGHVPCVEGLYYYGGTIGIGPNIGSKNREMYVFVCTALSTGKPRICSPRAASYSSAGLPRSDLEHALLLWPQRPAYFLHFFVHPPEDLVNIDLNPLLWGTRKRKRKKEVTMTATVTIKSVIGGRYKLVSELYNNKSTRKKKTKK